MLFISLCREVTDKQQDEQQWQLDMEDELEEKRDEFADEYAKKELLYKEQMDKYKKQQANKDEAKKKLNKGRRSSKASKASKGSKGSKADIQEELGEVIHNYSMLFLKIMYCFTDMIS